MGVELGLVQRAPVKRWFTCSNHVTPSLPMIMGFESHKKNVDNEQNHGSKIVWLQE